MPHKYNLEVRQNVARLETGGQSIESISATLGIPVRTLYRMERTFAKHDGGKLFEAPQNISTCVVPTLNRELDGKYGRHHGKQLEKHTHRAATESY